MLQPISSPINNLNTKKVPFGYSCRLNIPKSDIKWSLNYLEGILESKNIPQKLVRAQHLSSDKNAVVIVKHPDSLDVFVKEEVTKKPTDTLDVKDSGVLYNFANEKILLIFNKPLKS